MNRFFWLLLNLALVVVFCSIGLLLAGSNPRGRWDEVRKTAVAAEDSGTDKPQQPATSRDPTVAAVRDTMDSKTLEVLWRRSLFRPDRTEDVVAPTEEEGDEPTPQAEEWTFELRATAKMGDYLAAIIQIEAARRTPVRPVRPIRSVRRPGRPGIPEPKEEAPRAKKPKRLFREGDELNETGYTLVEIRMGEVLIRRGSDEPKVLTIDRMDAASVERREAAAKALAAEKPPTAEGKDEDKAPSRPASMPPPPPGGPGGPGTPTGATIVAPTAASAAMEARKKRIAEALQRRLEHKRTPRTTN